MCDPISLTLLGIGSAALGTFQTVEEISSAQDYNDAVIDAYDQELAMARSQAIIEQQNLNIETQAEQLANRQEERQMEQEAMVSNAAAEAAASSLNIAGNTAQRAAAVTDVNTLNRQGAFEARGENIQTQHLMNALGIKQNYDTQVESAKLNAEAAWKPMSGAVMSAILNGIGTATTTFAAGVSAGQAFGGLKIAEAGLPAYAILPDAGMLDPDSSRWNAYSGIMEKNSALSNKLNSFTSW